jgi:hypothetical protein
MSGKKGNGSSFGHTALDLSKRHGKKKTLGILAARLGRAVYHMLRKREGLRRASLPWAVAVAYGFKCC